VLMINEQGQNVEGHLVEEYMVSVSLSKRR
jgi:hypothetical protein